MMYPPRHGRRKDPWTATVQASHLKPSRYMDEPRHQKLLQLKQAEEENHHSFKLKGMVTQLEKTKQHTTSSFAQQPVPPEAADGPCPLAAQVTSENPPEGTIESRQDAEALCIKNEASHNLKERKTTQELSEEFKHLNWAKVDEFNSFKAKLEEQARAEERLRKQACLRNELEAQLRQQRLAKEMQKRESLETGKELQKELDLWRTQERDKQRIAHEKMRLQKEVLDAQMQERKKLQEETRAEQLRESLEVLEQVSRDLELDKRREAKAKQQKVRAMQEILEVTAAERRLAEARAKKEQEEDMRILKLSVQLETEAAERAKQERLALLSLHQSRADKIAMLATVDKKDLATQNAIKRDAADKARQEAMEKEAAARKKAEQLKVQEFLKLQQQEKARQRETEKQERYELQKQQEIDAKAYKEQLELAQRSRRELFKRQQELLVKQMDERKRSKDLLVSQTEMKLNRRLLEEVNDYLLKQSQAPQGLVFTANRNTPRAS